MIRATIRAALPFACAALPAPPAMAQTDEEPLFTTDYRGHTVEIYENGTWAFSDPSVRLADVGSFAAGGCLDTTGGRISYCGLPEGFVADSATTGSGVQEYGFTDAASGTSFTLTLDSTYGHAGDLGYYEGVAAHGGGGDFMVSLIAWFTGVEMQTEQAAVRDGIAVVEDGFRFEQDGTALIEYSMELITEAETFSISTSAFNAQGGAPLADFDTTLARLTANLRIDGMALPEWKAAANE